MTDRQPSSPPRGRTTFPTGDELLQTALSQFREECRLYNEAIGSYNTHLDNHRDRRDLHDLPYRRPITGHEAFDDAIDGDRSAIETIREDLVERAHLDSELRCHPRTYPIHIEATEQLGTARKQAISTLEEALQQLERQTT